MLQYFLHMNTCCTLNAPTSITHRIFLKRIILMVGGIAKFLFLIFPVNAHQKDVTKYVQYQSQNSAEISWMEGGIAKSHFLMFPVVSKGGRCKSMKYFQFLCRQDWNSFETLNGMKFKFADSISVGSLDSQTIPLKAIINHPDLLKQFNLKPL